MAQTVDPPPRSAASIRRPRRYAMIESSTILSIPTYFIICFVCLGLKETAIALSDPFGMDPVDFETDVFMARIMINTKELISRQASYTPKLMPLPADVPLTLEDMKVLDEAGGGPGTDGYMA